MFGLFGVLSLIALAVLIYRAALKPLVGFCAFAFFPAKAGHWYLSDRLVNAGIPLALHNDLKLRAAVEIAGVTAVLARQIGRNGLEMFMHQLDAAAEILVLEFDAFSGFREPPPLRADQVRLIEAINDRADKMRAVKS